MKHLLRIIVVIVLLPIIIFAMAVAALYYPPIQNWMVDKACDIASEKTGMEVSIDRVGLAFPLNVSLEGVKCVGMDSVMMRRDTLVSAQRVVCDVRFRPLIDGDVVLNAVELLGAKVNTSNFIDAVYIRGTVGRLTIDNPKHLVPPPSGAVAEVGLNGRNVLIPKATLDHCDLLIALRDSVPEDTTQSKPWGIEIDDISIADSRVDLWLNDSMEIDAGYLNARAAFEMLQDGKMTVGVRQCTLKERRGLDVKSLRADVVMDSARLSVDATLRTPASTLYAKMDMDQDAFADSVAGALNATVDASISRRDIEACLSIAGVASPLSDVPPMLFPLQVKGTVTAQHTPAKQADGKKGGIRILVPTLAVNAPGVISLNLSGSAEGLESLGDNPYSPDFKASLRTDARVSNTSFIMKMLDKSTAKTIKIPAFNAQCNVDIQGADYAFSASLKEGGGTVNAKGRYNMRNPKQSKVNARLTNFNVDHFLKGYNIGIVNGMLGYDGGYAKSDVNVNGPLINGDIDLNAHMTGKIAQGTVVTSLKSLDLYRLGVVDVPLKMAFNGDIKMQTDLGDYYSISGIVNDINIVDSAGTYTLDNMELDLLTRRDTTAVKASCGDLYCNLNARGGYQWLLGCSDRITKVIKNSIKDYTFNQEELRKVLPMMSLSLNMGEENPLSRIIAYNDIHFDTLHVDMNTSREEGVNAEIDVDGLNAKGYHADNVNIIIESDNDPLSINYRGNIRNGLDDEKKKNLAGQYAFDAYFDGSLLEHGVSVNTCIYDARKQIGLKLGAEANVIDNMLNLRLTPQNPIIGYQEFSINDDNYVNLTKGNRVAANVHLRATDGTDILIYSVKPDDEGYDESQRQNITLSLSHFDIGRVARSIPYAPNIEGMMYGDFHFVQEENRSFAISTDMKVQNMSYEDSPIGNVGTELVYIPKEDGTHVVDAEIELNGRHIGALNGSYNFENKKVDADFSMDRLPLEMINGFIPQQIVGLSGFADGVLSVHGTSEKPIVDGEIALDSCMLFSLPYGIALRMNDEKIQVQGSHLQLNNIKFYASDNSPLTVNGNIDFANTDHLQLALRASARNFLLIDSKETKHSEAYGKAYINLFCGINGELDKLNVRGRIDLLPATNLFYILKDSPLTADNRLKELVTFTDFSTEEPIIIQRPAEDNLTADMTINVQEGAHIKCWITPDHKNYLDFTGNGNLRLRYNNGESNMMGRFTISEGEMKYSLPIIPLKTFTIAPDSYVEFMGDIMNPRLNITATEDIRASVMLNGVSQICNFKTGVVLSKTLNDMGLEFIISAPENQTIGDELKIMSAEERGKVAVTMLTTGMYLADGNTGNFSMNSALSNFLQAEISNIAGSALRTVDLSFGMDNATEMDGTMHTDYTFKFAKRFWNNRLNISIGGKISTGPDVSGQNKSFFDNVDVQYRLSETANSYVTMFYKRSVYDYLEGYVGRFGAGYMWKKKAQTLRELFRKPAPIASPGLIRYQQGEKGDTSTVSYMQQNSTPSQTTNSSARENIKSSQTSVHE
jgi:hypothetical protein